jgi:hypothetical protein
VPFDSEIKVKRLTTEFSRIEYQKEDSFSAFVANLAR